MTPANPDDEAMRLIEDLEGPESIDWVEAGLKAASHLRRLLAEKAEAQKQRAVDFGQLELLRQENERMRKGLEYIAGLDVHRDKATNAEIITCAVLNAHSALRPNPLTPAPAVETKPKCETCYDTKIVMDDSGGRTRDVEVPCPDCATEGETK